MSLAEISFRGRKMDLSRPRIAGILNMTPDSFYDGGFFVSAEEGLERIAAMVRDGADIIDVGGESTRPGSDPVSSGEEMERVLPILEKAVPEFPEVLFSIDTTKYEVARAALEAGVQIVNDVSGLRNAPELASLCAEYDAGYVLMHSKGTPRDMQIDPRYEDVLAEVELFFHSGLERLADAGVKRVILDPGIGFGKTAAHNLTLIAGLERLGKSGYPLLVGASRKSLIGQILDNRPAGGRLAGTIALHYHCLINGARILRVHDVREAKDSVEIYNAVMAAQSEIHSI